MRDPVARRLARETPAGRTATVAAALLGAAAAGLALAQAVLLAGVIARGFRGTGLGTLAPAIVALAAVLAARALVAAGFDLVGRASAQRVMSDLRARVARRLLEEDPAGAAGERSGAVATAAVQGVDALEGWFSRYLPQVLLSALVPPAILAYLLTVDVTATAVLAATVPVLIVFMVLIGLAAQARTRARWTALSALGAHFADVVRGLPTLRAHVREAAQQQTMDAVSDQYRRTTMETLRVAFLSAFVLELAAMLGTALVAATVGLQLVAGDLDLRSGLVVLLLAPELYAPLRAVGRQFHASADGLASAERLFELLDRPAAVVAKGRGAAPDPAHEPVALEDVTFAHPDRGAPVLDGASLVLEPGETVALTGRSGAGKSTLASLLLRLADPQAGRVTCGGIALADVELDAWRARLAWVPQRPAIVAGTLADNVRLARPEATDAEVLDALLDAGAARLLAALPDGPATRIGDGGRALSAGEAQRVALARAFVRDARLVILDEPTAHLDPATAREVEDAIAGLCAGRTALLIAHSPELAARADRVVELRDGRLGEPQAATALELAA